MTLERLNEMLKNIRYQQTYLPENPCLMYGMLPEELFEIIELAIRWLAETRTPTHPKEPSA